MSRVPAHDHSLDRWRHDHRFDHHDASAERRVSIVLALTLVTMAAEIAAGLAFNSMALLADGIHMGTHAGALGIAAFAYRYARSHHQNPQFSFGTGKVASLAGFASAILLAVIALLTAWEAVARLIAPSPIDYGAALAVAVLGLAVNLGSAAILGGNGHGHHDAHDHRHHDHGHGHHAHGHQAHGQSGHKHHDHNLRAAYVHVLADAATSLLAIVALLGGRWMGWMVLDPIVALIGCAVIASWAWGLVRDTSAVLLDRTRSLTLHDDIRKAIESDGDSEVADMHIWRVGARAHVAMVTVVTHQARTPDHYKSLIGRIADIDHVTVEVNRCVPDGIGAGRT
jgi:cation diffusion facilitator family transporter